MGILKDLYLSLYLLSFRAAQSRGRGKIYSAVAGISLVDCFFVLSLLVQIGIATGHPLDGNRWMSAICLIVPISIANFYFLGSRGVGAAFESKFKCFGKAKQRGLLVASASIVVAVVVFFLISAREYQQAFHIVPPS